MKNSRHKQAKHLDHSARKPDNGKMSKPEHENLSLKARTSMPLLHPFTQRVTFSSRLPSRLPPNLIYLGDCERLLDKAAQQGRLFDLVFTSPPYNLGKPYNGYVDRRDLEEYLEWQRRIISKCVDCLSDTGSICWQVGNYVSNGHIIPLDVELAPVFRQLGLKLRNRVVWHFGHGLHCSKRFSGRYEMVLWYTKSDRYKFHLNEVRVPAKYPNKKHFRGKKKGQLSGNPLGKNPSDVWEDIQPEGAGDIWAIPNVKHNHVEKTSHPCQFPVGLAYRFIRALTEEGDTVMDPFLGVGTTAATAAMLNRRCFGAELNPEFFAAARQRIEAAHQGELRFRHPDKPIHRPSPSSQLPLS